MPEEDFHHDHHHVSHHEIRVKAFELWKAMKASHGVDYGPDYYWYQARFDLGIGPDPLPPPVE